MLKQQPSCPGLTRASTFFRYNGTKDVAGRDKPGHDEVTARVPTLVYRSVSFSSMRRLRL